MERLKNEEKNSVFQAMVKLLTDS